jgi:hypothetical protein
MDGEYLMFIENAITGYSIYEMDYMYRIGGVPLVV